MAAFAIAVYCSTSEPLVTWYAPFLAGGGYSSEAISYVLPLESLVPGLRIRQFAEHADASFVEGLRARDLEKLQAMMKAPSAAVTMMETSPKEVVVCHSTPDVWWPGAFGWDDYQPCPPPSARYAVGRTMYETDRLPQDWVTRCDRMDEVWVPTEFHKQAFERSGVDEAKVHVVPQAVDVEFFDPGRISPTDQATWGARAEPGAFRFLSVFKWEARKGWDVLLEAFAVEFSAEDAVELVLKTTPFHSASTDVRTVVDERLKAARLAAGLKGSPPRVSVVHTHVKGSDLPGLYASCDVFVLPSRGEGWGRPHVEAMAMGKPVIATNWSGPTAFLDESNGFPVRILDLVPVPEGSAPLGESHRWAEPDGRHLRARLREAFEDVDATRRRGVKAREDMLRRFSPEIVAAVVHKRLRAIAHRMEEPHYRRTWRARVSRRVGPLGGYRLEL